MLLARQFGSFEISTLTNGGGDYTIVRPGAGVVHLDSEWSLLSESESETGPLVASELSA